MSVASVPDTPWFQGMGLAEPPYYPETPPVWLSI
jgi:hypothetical protein